MAAKPYRWTPETIDRAIGILRGHEDLRSALDAMSRAFGREITRMSIDMALRKAGRDTASSYLRVPAYTPARSIAVEEIPVDLDEPDWSDDTDPAIGPTPSEATHSDLSRLAQLAKKYAKKGGLTLEALCDEMRLTPKDGRALTEKAIAAGYHVDIHNGVLDFREPDPIPKVEKQIELPPMRLGDEMTIGVVSDPHFASKHHEGDAIKRHVEWLYESGVRHILGPGDWVAGGYRFLKYEVTRNGIEEQSELVADFVQWAGPDITWHAIAGNHCESFDVGINAAKMIEQMLRARGWTNFHYHGTRATRLRFGPTRIAMHHPGGGLAYALSYKIQKYIDAMPLSERPHFLFTGHTHQKLWLERGGVNGFLCGTFENGDSSFGRMLGGEVQVGGWLIRYRHDEHGHVPEVSTTFRKQPHQRMNYIQVPTQVSA